jgi:hypothetical protein
MFLKSQQPYLDFLSALPLGECIERLQRREGKSADVMTHVQIGEADADRCTFQMRVQRAKRGLLDMTVYGVLERQDYGTTRVLVATEYVQHLATTWLITALTVLMGVVMALMTQNIFMLALPIGFSVVFYFVERHNYKQVVHLIETTLEAREKQKAEQSKA